MNGEESFGEYDFGNLYNKVKYQYEPEFRLDSCGTPQIVKITKADKADEDYIHEWLEASTPDFLRICLENLINRQPVSTSVRVQTKSYSLSCLQACYLR